MTQPGGRDSGGNSPIVATATQAGGTAIVATGGPVSGNAIVATGTGSGSAVVATAGTTGPAIIATGSTANAALRLTAQASPNGTNAIGDLFADSSGILWICTSAGSPGTFTKVGTQT